ncbi:MAG TPA: hypothetical protein VNR66_02555 [Solirubrobacteraceae bacterium]|nr:hypothetical protein [Solirubrobacteraceae bacterium]
MPRTFVTGGPGVIGGRLISRLVADGLGVRALSSGRAGGRVIASRPGSGAKRSNGTKINLVVSRGP